MNIKDRVDLEHLKTRTFLKIHTFTKTNRIIHGGH